MNRYLRWPALIMAMLWMAHSAVAYDNAHFYRATNFFFEPRLDRKYLSSLDLAILSGSTDKARNRNQETVPLLDIYGLSNMHELGVGVPGKDLSNPLDLILTQLALIPSRCSNKSCCNCVTGSEFATYSISGEFSTVEGIFSFIQNFKHGFFFQAYVPIRKLEIDNICFCDNSPSDGICPGINTLMWEIFKAHFDEILARYNLSKESYSSTNVGDTSLFLGWTHSYQDTEVLDFVDVSLRLGVLIPSGVTTNPDLIFSLPSGYDGHVGAVVVADFAFGAFEWLTIGAHFDAIVFGDKTQNIRLKTAPFQSGMIKLAKGEAKIDEGSILQAGAYVKADHFLRGLSLLAGYIFASKGSSEVTPCDPEKFPPSIANSDESLFGWKMHTLNFIVEFDFAQQHSQFGPRIGAFYNWNMGGKRIFETSTAGGYFGLDMAWDI